MTESTVTPGPREIFERVQRHWLENLGGFGSELAEDAVIEVPFAPPGRARRHEGKDAFLLFAGPEQAAFAQRFALDEVRDVVVHETADPEVIVVEYELAGRVLATGQQASSPFIGVLRVRDGKIVNWREYQNTLAMIEIMGGRSEPDERLQKAAGKAPKNRMGTAGERVPERASGKHEGPHQR